MNLSPQPLATEDTTRLLEAKLRLEARARNGASWFYWIGGLSVINSVIATTGGTFTLLFGLAVTQLITAFASVVEPDLGIPSPGIITFVGLALSLLAGAFFGLIGYAARKRIRGLYILGIVLYGVDGLLSLVLQDWLGALFHLFALAGLVGGLSATRTLGPIEAGTAPLETLRTATIDPEQQRRSRRRILILVAAIVIVCLFAYAVTLVQAR